MRQQAIKKYRRFLFKGKSTTLELHGIVQDPNQQLINKLKMLKNKRGNKGKVAMLSYFSLFLLITSFSLKAQEVKIIDNHNKVVSDVLLLKGGLYYGNFSNKEGWLTYPKDWENNEVMLHKLGYMDTLVILKRNSIYTLKIEEYAIREVEVRSEFISPLKQLQQYVEFNIPLMQLEQDSFCLDLEHQLWVSERLKEIRRGDLKFVYNGYNKKQTAVWKSEYCRVKAKVDSSFWNSAEQKSFVNHTLLGIFEYDGMRSHRLLRKEIYKRKFHKDSKISRVYTAKTDEFEIISGKDKIYLTKITFNKDSTISTFSHRRIDTSDIKSSTCFINAKHTSLEIYIKYTESRPITLDSIYSKFGFINKDDFPYQVYVTAKQNATNCKNCLKRSILYEFTPEMFNKKSFLNYDLEYF